jgi:hypothetical protein
MKRELRQREQVKGLDAGTVAAAGIALIPRSSERSAGPLRQRSYESIPQGYLVPLIIVAA